MSRSAQATNQGPEKEHRCPACEGHRLIPFYRVSGVPTQSVLLRPTRAAAINAPCGDISLHGCSDCGFIFNPAFDPNTQNYNVDYRPSQGCSTTFSRFHQDLAGYLVDRHGLHNRTVVEIGCGQGEFLQRVCRLGQNRGYGFDPSLVERNEDDVTLIKDVYSARYRDLKADYFICQMTLEHLADPAALIDLVHDAAGGNPDAVVFFQVPDVRRIITETAFWDIYYEHCNYFSPGSLARLLRRRNFLVRSLWTGHQGQYVMLTAQPSRKRAGEPLPGEDTPEEMRRWIQDFSQETELRCRDWSDRLATMAESGKETVLWGGGSKAVAFCTTLTLRYEIKGVVDIDPAKAGTFIAGTGQEIVSPEALRAARPDAVIVMNPIYMEEIREELSRMDLRPELIPITARPAGRLGPKPKFEDGEEE
ncbi:MAG: methyltransferase domain-containing protein [Desulfobacterales bacterium]|nr:methyltransferase domain-containing protein [Desulfobacterales bacterium]